MPSGRWMGSIRSIFKRALSNSGLPNLLVSICAVLSFAPSIFIEQNRPENEAPPTTSENSQILARVQSAWNGRAGAILVIDPQTGRILTLVNSGMIFDQATPPG